MKVSARGITSFQGKKFCYYLNIPGYSVQSISVYTVQRNPGYSVQEDTH